MSRHHLDLFLAGTGPVVWEESDQRIVVQAPVARAVRWKLTSHTQKVSC